MSGTSSRPFGPDPADSSGDDPSVSSVSAARDGEKPEDLPGGRRATARQAIMDAGHAAAERYRNWVRDRAEAWQVTEDQVSERVGLWMFGAFFVAGLVATAWWAASWVARHVVAWWTTGLQAAGVGSDAHNPVKTYLITHAAGLPWDGTTLMHAWVVTGAGVWVLAVLRVRAAQLGWIGYVAATAAMAYAGSARPSAAIAAGIVVTAAVVLSVPVARRSNDGPDLVMVPPNPDQIDRPNPPAADTAARSRAAQ